MAAVPRVDRVPHCQQEIDGSVEKDPRLERLGDKPFLRDPCAGHHISPLGTENMARVHFRFQCRSRHED